MNGYPDITTSIEKNRNSLRRIARHDDQEFSKESIINVMERFVKTVNTMDDTILVPCRLMDLQIGDAADPNGAQNGQDKAPHANECLDSTNLFNLYNMLNAFKVTLLWGKNGCERKTKSSNSNSKINENSSSQSMATAAAETTNDDNTNILNPTATTTTIKGHARRTSTASTNSINSGSTISDSESDISTENDSGVELENNTVTTPNDKSTQLALECRNHLMGLHRCLEQMTDAALYLTARYQNDVEPV